MNLLFELFTHYTNYYTMLRLHKLYESRITIVVSIFGNYNYLTMNYASALTNLPISMSLLYSGLSLASNQSAIVCLAPGMRIYQIKANSWYCSMTLTNNYYYYCYY